MDGAGGFLPFSGDSGPNINGLYPIADVFGTRGDNFWAIGNATPSGEIVVRVGYDGIADTEYDIVIKTNTNPNPNPNLTSIPEPSSLAPMAAAAAGLGFVALRRRRKKS